MYMCVCGGGGGGGLKLFCIEGPKSGLGERLTRADWVVGGKRPREDTLLNSIK